MSSKTYISANAKRLTKIICDEFALQAERVAGGFLKPDRVQACLLERLNAKSQRDPALREFLVGLEPIPEEDDTSPDRPWAEDLREDSSHEVRTGTCRGIGVSRNARCIEDEQDHPLPGERIC